MYPVFSMTLITALTALLASVLGPIVTFAVARHQFRASVVSANRQKWIDTFRDHLAELLSVMDAAQVVKKASADAWRGGAVAVHDNPALAEKIEKTFMAVAHIQLLTKGDEPVHQTLNEAIATALGHLLEDDLNEGEVSARILEITAIARGIIRDEWRRVKRGV